MQSLLRSTFVVTVALLTLPSRLLAAQHCTSIEYDAERLACYDAYFSTVGESLPVAVLEESADQSEYTVTPLEERLPAELDETGDLFAIRPHHPNYILPFTHNFDSDFENYGPIGRTFVDEEIKMQISLKTPLARDLWLGSSLWFAYTQQSYWQLYAEDFASAPFRETNYQPEIFWRVPLDREVFGWRAKEINLGINHQSNGQTQRLSRSWNRFIAEAVFDRGGFEASIRAWHRFEEDAENDDNPDIEDFMGRAQFGLSYERGKQTYSINVVNNLRSNDNRSGVELNWMFPLVEHVKGYVQYYSGYGENLFDAENYVNRIGIGFALNNGR
ncbi:MAG: phospholipase A [Pseudomonadota bacterium]